MSAWHRISRADAVARAAAEFDGECLICRLATAPTPGFVVAESAHAVLSLTRLPLRPGHLMVLLREHAVAVSECPADAWTDLWSLARRGAVALERVLAPARVYLASLGTALDDLPHTSPHLHVHAVPVHDPTMRPRQVLTWQHGVYTAADDEAFVALARQLREALPAE